MTNRNRSIGSSPLRPAGNSSVRPPSPVCLAPDFRLVRRLSFGAHNNKCVYESVFVSATRQELVGKRDCADECVAKRARGRKSSLALARLWPTAQETEGARACSRSGAKPSRRTVFGGWLDTDAGRVILKTNDIAEAGLAPPPNTELWLCVRLAGIGRPAMSGRENGKC
jgi:hypothetical protein